MADDERHSSEPGSNGLAGDTPQRSATADTAVADVTRLAAATAGEEWSCRKRSATTDTAVAGDTRLAPAFAGEELQ